MVHQLPEDKLHLIFEMDRKIGEFMQKRADIVNRIIAGLAQFNVGDLVELFEGEVSHGRATVVQPLFVKKHGVVTYRLRSENGEVFTNETYVLRLLQAAEQQRDTHVEDYPMASQQASSN